MAVTYPLLSNSSTIKVGTTVVGRLLSWDYSETDSQIDITNFDSTRREFANADLVDADVNIEAQFDLADTGQDAIITALAGAAVAIVIYPNGSAAGNNNPSLTSTILVGSHSVSASGIEDVINVSFSGKMTGITVGLIV